MGNFLKGLANKDGGTTLLGALGAGVVAANIDYSKLLQGDHAEAAKAIGAAILALFGYLTNKGSAHPQEPKS